MEHTLLDRLLDTLADGHDEEYRQMQQQRVLKECNEPHFEETTRVHDWRNYIPDEVAETWEEFPLEARLAMWMMAEKQASNEEWE